MAQTTASAVLGGGSKSSTASLAAALDIEGNIPIESVQIEALVVMKILKHSREAQPATVSGQLLGLDVEKTLEITHCYPVPTGSAEGADEIAQYQVDMMQCLREVNVDSNAVGWYQSAHLDSILEPSIIEMQYNYQKNLKKSVLLVYDLSSTTRGNVSLRAFRLTPEFMELYKKGVFTTQSFTLAGVTFDNIMTELPVVIHNSAVLNMLMHELSEPAATADPASMLDSRRLFSSRNTGAGSTLVDSAVVNPAALDLSLNAPLEKNLESLLESVDKYNYNRYQYQYWQRGVAREQSKIQQYIQRRRLENATRIAAGLAPLPEETESQVEAMFNMPKEPSRLNHILAAGKVDNYCKQINQFSGPALSKIFTIRELQQ
ncbi:eukaryotic translation initiation factor 3 subunit 3 [Dimargaris cristalligena]|uniref:Eukaryotic translation initiation factor 3 subunit H n=1 Tax=Dimargaris cristalligena TaxID=215637 RepID=A0A4P9ZXJ3_9FUNG|nr:eukaryotic translation initiation factor 3 subunit 3 [Dimargaris cristalligena]|eukprot:RKP38425.1 eukaryotic translation initiation factor 3 subunit 3 [Dimargaris cristalligena]